MKEYKFLLKPIFFIFNLLFATWLVMKIEELKPSDFGQKDPSIEKPAAIPVTSDKLLLRSLLESYKNGQLDSINVNKKLDEVLEKIKRK
jgi:hypothetical protein